MTKGTESLMSNDKEWERVKAHFDAMRQAYVSAGAVGQPALFITFAPLLARYERGERSQELYDAMAAVE